MKKLTILFLVILSSAAFAQVPSKIVLHLQSADTVVHRSLVNQVSNLKKAFPEASIELVCHGPGLNFLLKEKSKYADKLNSLKVKDFNMVGCEFTMKSHNYTKADLVPYTGTVPFGIAELAKKQAEGWVYIKLGF